jgi:hypothetical protein
MQVHGQICNKTCEFIGYVWMDCRSTILWVHTNGNLWPFAWATKTLIELPNRRIFLRYPSFELGACILKF